MLLKKNRIKENDDFKRIVTKGRFLTSENKQISINYLPNQKEVNRAGFVVGKKFSVRAVDRNRAKRVLREAFKRILPQLRSGYDFVVVFRKKPEANIKLRDTLVEIEKILKKNNLYKK